MTAGSTATPLPTSDTSPGAADRHPAPSASSNLLYKLENSPRFNSLHGVVLAGPSGRRCSAWGCTASRYGSPTNRALRLQVTFVSRAIRSRTSATEMVPRCPSRRIYQFRAVGSRAPGEAPGSRRVRPARRRPHRLSPSRRREGQRNGTTPSCNRLGFAPRYAVRSVSGVETTHTAAPSAVGRPCDGDTAIPHRPAGGYR